MDLEFEYEEKKTYSLEEVQGLVEGFKGLAIEEIGKVKESLSEPAVDEEALKELKELQEGNHLLQIKNLAISNGIDNDLFDLIVDDDIEVVKSKIEKLKTVTKENKIDNSFRPTDNRSEDAYTKAENNKDVKGMLSQKINKIFN